MVFAIILLLLAYVHWSLGESFIPKTRDRTAVIISGHLRSGNFSLDSNDFEYSDEDTWKINPLGVNVTVIHTVQEFLLKPLALHGGVDLFIYFMTKRTKHKWDGDPRKFEHYVGDIEACKVYANHPIFHRSTGNKVFCQTAYEHERKDYFVRQYPLWQHGNEKYDGSEAYLNQLYGHYMGNMASKEYSKLSGVQYKYKVRLRPDMVMWGPISDPSTLILNGPSTVDVYTCNRRILIPLNENFGFGTQDSFNFGESEDMDHLLDRYMDHITKPYVFDPNNDWVSEYFVAILLAKRYGICLHTESSFLMKIARLKKPTEPPPPPPLSDFQGHRNSDWILLNQ